MAQPLPERRLTLVEKLQGVSDRLDVAVRDASDERRATHITDRVFDEAVELGMILYRIGRARA